MTKTAKPRQFRYYPGVGPEPDSPVRKHWEEFRRRNPAHRPGAATRSERPPCIVHDVALRERRPRCWTHCVP